MGVVAAVGDVVVALDTGVCMGEDVGEGKKMRLMRVQPRAGAYRAENLARRLLWRTLRREGFRSEIAS